MEQEKSCSEISFKADKFQGSPIFTTPATSVGKSLKLRLPKENGKEVGIKKLMELEDNYHKVMNKIPKELGQKEQEALTLCEEEIHEILQKFQEEELNRLKENKLYQRGLEMMQEIEEEQRKLKEGAYQEDVEPLQRMRAIGKFSYFLEELLEPSLNQNFEVRVNYVKGELFKILKKHVSLKIEEKKND